MSAPLSKEQWAEARRLSTDAVLERIERRKALLPYQSRVIGLLESTGCEVLFVEKSRRIGLTWGFAAYAVLKAARTKAAGGMDVMYISYSQEMTREFIDACAMWARAFNELAGEIEETVFDDSDEDGERSINAFRIKFASGFEIIGLSSAPRSLRGKQGVVMIDEAAFVDSLKELLKAALAFLMWGGQVVVCSTHDGVDNHFNEQIQDILAGRKPYKHVRITFDDALQDGLHERICLVTGKQWSPEGEAEWRQNIIKFYGDGADEELFCIPTQGSGTWLPGPLIEARMTLTPEDAPIIRLELPANYLHLSPLQRTIHMAPCLAQLAAALKKLHPERRHAFGFDFGRVADLSVAKLLSIDKLLCRRSALTVEMRNVPGDEQKLITRMILKGAPRLVGAAVDATGMGWTVAEDMGRIFGFRSPDGGGGLIDPIKFTSNSDWYRINMPPLRGAFEDDGMLELVKDDEHLGDIRLVKVIRGIPRIPDLRTGETNKKRHGDFVVALALAYYASLQQWFEYGYMTTADLQDGSGAEDDDESEYGRRHW
ncbi:hypothetical protein P7F60_28910 [Rhizobium sp. YJ-22]|uniref:hypothetical protein n=1 Tax=Rhizobium sp. YJ-22 TaxID=3037556 RepID=UPI002412B95A|nr:hypothetical protein [Rhizobium sp. YJ-22]MDG3580404.1 hypothetical protein [Rhizobium sp. YJ-22]